MINWNDPESWSCPVPDLRAVPEIFEALGRKIYLTEWTGRERDLIKPVMPPKPADVYVPVVAPAYPTVYRKALPEADTGGKASQSALSADKIANYVVYNQYADHVAKIVGLGDFVTRTITFTEWCIGYDKCVDDLRIWTAAADRRNIVFTWIHRRAAGGDIIFRLFDPVTGSQTVLDRDVWSCSFEVARARFLRGAFSLSYPNTKPPADPEMCRIFDASFDLNLYADNASVVRTVRKTVREDVSTAPADIIDRTAKALLEAADNGVQSLKSSSPQDAEFLHDGPSSKTPPTKEAVLAIVRESVAARLGAEPTRLAVKAAFPTARITRRRVREIHAGVWLEMYEEILAPGAKSRKDNV